MLTTERVDGCERGGGPAGGGGHDRRLLAALQDMARVFEGRHVSAERLAIYAEDLSDLPVEAVVAAIGRLRRTNRFFPVIAEIREAVVAGQPVEGLAELAWIEVQGEALRVGWNPRRVFRAGVFLEPEKPRFTSEITAAAVASLSWRAICLTEDAEEVVFLRNQFVKTWNALASRALKQAQVGAGAGMEVLGGGAAGERGFENQELGAGSRDQRAGN